MATPHSMRTAGRSTTIGMIGAAALLTAALVGSLLIALWPATPLRGPAPAAPAAAPALAAPAAGGPTNRFFADEVAGAGAQYAEAASLAGPLPERLQDLARPAAPQEQARVPSRRFADEIAAGADVADPSALALPAAPPHSGPR